MIAQRLTFVFTANNPRRRSNGTTLGDEHVQHRWQHRGHQIEPVRRSIAEPVLDQIGDLLRRPGGDEMSASSRHIAQKLTQRGFLAAHETDDHLGAAARGLHRGGVGEILG